MVMKQRCCVRRRTKRNHNRNRVYSTKKLKKNVERPRKIVEAQRTIKARTAQHLNLGYPRCLGLGHVKHPQRVESRAVNVVYRHPFA